MQITELYVKASKCEFDKSQVNCLSYSYNKRNLYDEWERKVILKTAYEYQLKDFQIKIKTRNNHLLTFQALKNACYTHLFISYDMIIIDLSS